MLYVEIAFVLMLSVLNGLLAMSEMAIVSSRRSRLEGMARRGNRAARTALGLAGDPSRFLSTVQIGITLVGILAGAVSGATLADRLGDWLDGLPGLAPNGDAIAIAVVVAGITYLSLIVGELVPKRIALANPERVACAVARPMVVASRIAAPAVWLLKVSTEAILRAIRLRSTGESAVTEEEVRSLVAEGARIGVFAPQEREMVEGVFRLADRQVGAIMTPRPEIEWLDIDDDPEESRRKLTRVSFSRLLVCKGSVDHALGVVHTKDLLSVALRRARLDIGAAMVPPMLVPESTSALKLLEMFRHSVHVAVVIDEYGVTQGLVTPTDILEGITGYLPERGEVDAPQIARRGDGSWLVDGSTPIDEFADRLALPGIDEDGGFHTVAGFVLHRLGHLPRTGETFAYREATFEIVDMDGRRIDKILVRLHDRAEPRPGDEPPA